MSADRSQNSSFVPAPVPPVDTGSADDIDPVTFELLRHGLLLVNQENGATVLSTSGSPVVVYGRDFNSALLTATGEYVYFGRYIQIHSGVIDLAVRYLLESSATQTIRPGDMYFTNDPWIASGHGNDIIVLAPVFAGERLLLWVANTLHHIDLGGSRPGGRDVVAESAYEETTLFPMLKIVEEGRFRSDIAAAVERQSRFPEYAALDLRAQVAGNKVAAERIGTLVERHGPDAIVHSIQRIIAMGESAFLRLLRDVPDGTWRERTYIDGSRPDDRQLHRVGMSLTKAGDVLTFADDGTAPQQRGPINCTFAAWRAGIVCALMAQAGHESPFAPGGILRHVRFAPRFGTILNADFPAPVNRGTGLGLLLSGGLASQLLAKALVCNPSNREDLLSVSGNEPVLTMGMTGRSETGSSFFRVFTDTMACGSSALQSSDGDHTGGAAINGDAPIPNVEETEDLGATLFLFRQQGADSGGAGRSRGGDGISFGIFPFRSRSRELHLYGSGVAVPPFSGLFGGYPGRNRHVRIVRNARVLESIRGGRLPSSLAEIQGETELLPGKAQGVRLGDDDVAIVVGGGGTGFGDPLERPPGRVAADCLHGRLSRAAALEFYGVVLGADRKMDEIATEQRREAIRAQRSSGLHTSADPTGMLSTGPHPAIDLRGRRYACNRCSFDLGSSSEWYLAQASVRLRHPTDYGGVYLDPGEFVDGEVIMREYSCPGCGTLLDVDVGLLEDPPPQSSLLWP